MKEVDLEEEVLPCRECGNLKHHEEGCFFNTGGDGAFPTAVLGSERRDSVVEGSADGNILNPRITPQTWERARELAHYDPPSITAEDVYAIVWAEYLYWRESDCDNVEAFAIGPISNILASIRRGSSDLTQPTKSAAHNPEDEEQDES